MIGLQLDEQIARIALVSGNQGTTTSVKTYLTDALGSVMAIANADQTLEVCCTYSPYGQTQKVGVENQQTGSENSSQYTGRENDNNGLYYYRARYYDPVLKRFISEDPIGLAGGINSHAYVGGDPVSFTDPEGEIPAIIVGMALSGLLEIVTQMSQNYAAGCDLFDIDWWDVGVSTAIGAIGLPGAVDGARLLVKSQMKSGLRNHTRREVARSQAAKQANRDLRNAKEDMAYGSWSSIIVDNTLGASLKDMNGDSRCKCPR